MRFIALLALLLVACASFATTGAPAGASSFPSFIPSGNSTMFPGLQERMQSFNLTTESELALFYSQRTLIVIGSNMDAQEKAAYQSAIFANPAIANATQISDSPEQDALAQIGSGRYLMVVLIGGPSQNEITKNLSGAQLSGEQNETFANFFVRHGWTSGGSLLIIVSDAKGYYNAPREGLKYSPLSGIIPDAYIPVAATGISAILLALFSIARTIFEFKFLDIGRKGQKVGESSLMLGGFNLMEPLAIGGASLVLGVSISWQYFGPTTDFVFWAIVNTFICLGAAILHEVSHRVLAHAFGFRVEYRFWTAGSALTLISSWLGNAFSVQGFLLEDIPENAVKWKVALMRIVGPLISTATMLLFAIINFLVPNTLFQMIYSTSALWAIAEVFPFSGLDGKDLKDWNVFVWFAAFVLVAGAYVFVTFVL